MVHVSKFCPMDNKSNGLSLDLLFLTMASYCVYELFRLFYFFSRREDTTENLVMICLLMADFFCSNNILVFLKIITPVSIDIRIGSEP